MIIKPSTIPSLSSWLTFLIKVFGVVAIAFVAALSESLIYFAGKRYVYKCFGEQPRNNNQADGGY